jgi:hypothetical protein
MFSFLSMYRREGHRCFPKRILKANLMIHTRSRYGFNDTFFKSVELQIGQTRERRVTCSHSRLSLRATEWLVRADAKRASHS